MGVLLVDGRFRAVFAVSKSDVLSAYLLFIDQDDSGSSRKPGNRLIPAIFQSETVFILIFHPVPLSSILMVS
jgi:hypothetical protein